MPMNFRALVCALALAPLVAPSIALAQKSKTLDLGTPEGALAAMRKIQCSTQGQRPGHVLVVGDMYSRVPGERDRLLFKVEGMNVRQCVAVTDPVRRARALQARLARDPVLQAIPRPANS
jgi:hypothetical protein